MGQIDAKKSCDPSLTGYNHSNSLIGLGRSVRNGEGRKGVWDLTKLVSLVRPFDRLLLRSEPTKIPPT
jgi:hypothetical protein